MYLNQSRAALAAIAVVIPLAMLATVYTGRPAQQASQENEKITVVASFYPLYEFASKIGGDRIEVSSLVPAGVEPHDWEPTSRDVLRVSSADILVLNGAGLESQKTTELEANTIVDTSKGLELLQLPDGRPDPHIWLDPVLAKQQVLNIRDAIIGVDPQNADYYQKNAQQYVSELDSLDKFIASGLADCEKKDFIAFHEAFSYFAKRYGLNQHSIQGLSPQGEVLPQRIEEIIRLAGELKIDTVYSEDLVDPRLANVIADEIPNGKVLILSPVEGLNDEEQKAGLDYIDKMKLNVANLKAGLGCR